MPQATAAGNSRRQQPQATAFFLILTFFFALNSCQKTETPISQSNEADTVVSVPVESRDLELTDVAKYYVDNVETTKSNYDNQSPSLWFHDVVSKEGNDRVTKSYAFSTKAIYETWGNTVGIPVSKLNQFDDRVDALVIKYGIAPIVESGATPSKSVMDSYLGEVQTAYDDLFPSTQANGLYAGSKFWSNSCTPGSNGCTNASAIFLPIHLTMATWLSLGIWGWMEDNSEGWEPMVTANNSTPFRVTLRAYSYPGFFTPFWQQWVKRTTVNIPANANSLFVPFSNSLQIWNNRISSWMIFPSVF